MSSPLPDRVTLLLKQAADGDAAASNEVLDLLYGELRELAQRVFSRQGASHTLQPTALVHEAWVKLGTGRDWDNRNHFFAVAATAMRQVLINHARDAQTQKRGGAWERITMQGLDERDPQSSLDLLALNEALERLGQVNERYLRVFEMRYFAGLETNEIAEILEVTPRTVQLAWRATRAFLSTELEGGA